MHVDEGDDPKGRPLRRISVRGRAVGLGAALLLALGACATSTSGTGRPSPSTSASVHLTIYRLGAQAKSAKGTVTIHGYDGAVPPSNNVVPASGDRFVAIDVEGCAGTNADENTGIEPLLFYLQLRSQPIYPIDQVVKEPALHKTSLAPGRCARGWVTFQVPMGSKPEYAFFRSLSRIAWVLPR
jgi:uncharacterized protein DUF4352